MKSVSERRTIGERWDREGLLKVGVWELQPNGPQSEERRIKVRAPVDRDQDPDVDLPERAAAEPEHNVRRTYLSREDFRPEKYGYTEGCQDARTFAEEEFEQSAIGRVAEHGSRP